MPLYGFLVRACLLAVFAFGPHICGVACAAAQAKAKTHSCCPHEEDSKAGESSRCCCSIFVARAEGKLDLSGVITPLDLNLSSNLAQSLPGTELLLLEPLVPSELIITKSDFTVFPLGANAPPSIT